MPGSDRESAAPRGAEALTSYTSNENAEIGASRTTAMLRSRFRSLRNSAVNPNEKFSELGISHVLSDR